jgi:SAM-dependent methyltransferase
MRLRFPWRRPLESEDPLAAMDDPTFVDLAYRFLLGRAPDEHGRRHFLGRLEKRAISRELFLDALVESQEFARSRLHSELGTSIHESRSRFVKGLPPARRIVDIGGSCQGSRKGAMVELGYPYDFELLTIVDLPDRERHELYRSEGGPEVERVPTERGPVEYLYQSMTTLRPVADSSVDLVYSGQSIEHVSRADAATVYSEVLRVLKPGAVFALDTPNARVTRLQQDELIDPDHEHEYTHRELSGDLAAAGFEVVAACGLNYAGPIASRAEFSTGAVAAGCGLYAAIEDCYILAYVCRKPTPLSS